MKGNYKIYPIGRETSASGGYGLFIESSRLLDTTFRYIEDAFGNNSALKLNRATVDGFVMVEAPNAANTAGIYVAVAGTIIGDFRADLTNGFAMVAQSTYPISFYTQNTAKLNARFEIDGSVSIGGTGNDGKINWKRSFDGNGVAAMGVRPGFSDWYFEGNNVNFRTNSTGFFFGGRSTWETPTARLHVRGDGTNPIQRWENDAGVSVARLDNSGVFTAPTFNIETPGATAGLNFYNVAGIFFTTSAPVIRYRLQGSSNLAYHLFDAPIGATSGIQKVIGIESNFASGAGTASFRPLNIEYTINNSGAQTGTATGIFLNATETALNGMTHNLMNLQVGGVSKFRITSNAATVNIDINGMQFANNVNATDFNAANPNWGYSIASIIYMLSDGSGNLVLQDSGGSYNSNFNMLKLGGNTDAFPAIKRSGVGLQIRRADDLAYSDLEVSTLLAAAGIVYLNTSANVFIIRGTGSPEGTQSGGVGSMYLRTDGGAGTTLYVKESGTGNTGWVAK